MRNEDETNTREMAAAQVLAAPEDILPTDHLTSDPNLTTGKPAGQAPSSQGEKRASVLAKENQEKVDDQEGKRVEEKVTVSWRTNSDFKDELRTYHAIQYKVTKIMAGKIPEGETYEEAFDKEAREIAKKIEEGEIEITPEEEKDFNGYYKIIEEAQEIDSQEKARSKLTEDVKQGRKRLTAIFSSVPRAPKRTAVVERRVSEKKSPSRLRSLVSLVAGVVLGIAGTNAFVKTNEDLREEAKNAKAALTKESEEHKKIKTQYDQAKEAAKGMVPKKQYDNEITKNGELEEALAEASTQHGSALEDAKTAYQSKLEAAKTQYQTDLEAAKTQHDSALEEALAEASTQHESALEDAKKEAKDKYQTDLEAAKAATKTQHGSALEDAKTAYQSKLEAAKTQYQTDLAKLEKQLAERPKPSNLETTTSESSDPTKTKDPTKGYTPISSSIKTIEEQADKKRKEVRKRIGAYDTKIESEYDTFDQEIADERAKLKEDLKYIDKKIRELEGPKEEAPKTEEKSPKEESK